MPSVEESAEDIRRLGRFLGRAHDPLPSRAAGPPALSARRARFITFGFVLGGAAGLVQAATYQLDGRPLLFLVPGGLQALFGVVGFVSVRRRGSL